jgi:hypothetical protein
MDIEFRNASGSRVGFIIGNDIKDTNGNRVGMIVGNDIKDSYGNRVGILNGSDIKDINGNRVGMIIGNDIKDTYGNRVGYPISGASQMEMAAAGLLLFGLKPAEDSANSSKKTPINTSSSSDKNRNSSKNENGAVSSGSVYDNMASSLVSSMDESSLIEFSKMREKMFYEQRKREEKQKKEEEEKWHKECEVDREAWKKKKIFVYGLGGLIGGLFFTFFYWLVANYIGFAIVIILGIGITSIVLFYRETLTFCFLKGILAGAISFSILGFLAYLVGILPFPALFFPIGFILGVFIIWLMRNYFYWIEFKEKNQLKSTGLCPKCGSKIKYRYGKYGNSRRNWYSICSSCDYKESLYFAGPEIKKIKKIKKTLVVIAAIAGSLLLNNVFLLIPFAITFLIPSDTHNGFVKFIRMIPIIVLGILSIVKIVNIMDYFSFPWFILGPIGLILLIISSIMAYKQSLTGEW